MNDKDINAFCTDVQQYLLRHGRPADRRAMLAHLHRASAYHSLHWLWRHPIRIGRAIKQFYHCMKISRIARFLKDYRLLGEK